MSAGGQRWPAWLAGGAGAAALAWLWPRSVLLRGDDFGYVEAAAAAIRGQWPPISDWLEPFNLVLPALAAAVFSIGGSFYAATLGVVAVLAALNYFLLRRWLRPTLPAGGLGEAALAALALLPVALNKTIEFTGVPLSWAFMLAALLAWRARAAGWFFAAVVVGVLNRQSAVCLLALPLCAAALRWRRGERPEPRWLAGLALAAAAIGLIVVAMPVNFARGLTAQRMAATAPLAAAGAALLAAGFAGGIAAAWTLLRGESAGMATRDSLSKHPWFPLVWLGGGATALTAGVDLACETPALARFSGLLIAGAFGLSAAVPRALGRVAPEALAAAALYAALVSWRGVWWDYYVCDLALLLALPRTTAEVPPESRKLAAGAALALAAFAVVWLVPLRWQLRWAEGSGRAHERALRAGTLTVTEISQAPFGQLGWKLFPALVAQGPQPGGRLSDFSQFVEAGRSLYRGGEAIPLPPGDERRSLHGPAAPRRLPENYQPRPFPLNDAEWRDWLRPSPP
ncbi:MAG: hypothetical protein JNL39_19515 [Opitutaceae bacterium]|nr:hypothetical protein [Opitutaceae bacterium]